MSTHNFSFRGLNKKIADLNSVSLLASYVSQIQTKILSKGCYQFKKLIHKKVDEVRFNYGLLCAASDYYKLLEQEIKMDYSMGYKDEVRYRASTAIPFYFYDLKNDIQTPLRIYPVVAEDQGLSKFSTQKAFKKLEDLYQNLPTRSAFHSVSFSNAILNPREMKNLWRDQFINYLRYHAK